MATLYPVAGCKIYIGPAMDLEDGDMVAADFTSVVWTEVKKWTSMGAYGDAAALITTQVISEARDVKQKGTRNAGQMQNVFAVAATDPGQIALIAAEKTNLNYPIKVELNDKPAVGASPKNSMRYFMALVTSAQEAGGAANTVQSLNSTFEINSNIVPVAASAT
ncbi:hypothetical protein [Phyllobacterium chamaecytisi]|uniref:hypothetical protein n=1 Tax=Phyllobacterium chamaecytisi TaxID=2876082 RepID=UPI001CCBFAB0|nr:hypothetical protein [Phyllobacterium sp. KW56]MBZ9600754.1 hypothetical protein [Phyllobacterium sp. KW56]